MPWDACAAHEGHYINAHGMVLYGIGIIWYKCGRLLQAVNTIQIQIWKDKSCRDDSFIHFY